MDFLNRSRAAIRRHPWRLLWLLALVPVIAAAFTAVYVAGLMPQTPSVDKIRTVRAQQPSVLLSEDGKELAVFRRTNREWVKLADVSPKVLDALIATEDQRFFEHKGLDVRRTISAAFHTVRGDLQGGSTISQQLARNMFPDEIGRAPTLERKVKEAITALRIESLYSKEEILEIYLNTVPFLYNAYGIEMAARTYFDKSANELDTIQAATLIGMLKGTSYYNPVLNPERAVARRNTVLAQLVKSGKLEPAQFDKLKTQPLGLDFEKQEEDLGPAPHFAQQLKRWLIAWADKRGYNIYADGLVVRTTLDSRLQQMATDALTREADKLQQTASKVYAKPTRNKQLLDTFVRETAQYHALREAGQADADALKKLETDTEFITAMWREKTRIEAAFLAQDPTNGHVKAWVGSRDFKQDQFDHVQQAKRQPGSTFKPFVYGAAFDMGMSPNDLFIDQAMEIRLDDNTTWKPGDVHEATNEPTTLREGLVHSKNSITAQLVQRVGANRVARVAQNMGVRQSKLDEVPSLALGTSPVTLKEMVSAYSTIAHVGTYIEPVIVLRIENRKGQVIEEFHPRAPEQALSIPATQTLVDVMRGVVDRGTGAAIRSRYGLKGDLAGKTGTTQDNTDGWFILMHPQLVAGAWVGFNDARITMGDSWGQGARNALPIVGTFMQQTVKANLVDTKAKFNAPKDNSQPDPDAIARMQEWWAGVQQAMQPQVIPAASEQMPATQPQVIVISPPSSRQGPATQDLPWAQDRQRSTQFQDSAGFAAPPPLQSRPPLVIRVPQDGDDRRGTAELGAGPYRPPLDSRGDDRYAAPAFVAPPPPPPEGGVRILRAY